MIDRTREENKERYRRRMVNGGAGTETPVDSRTVLVRILLVAAVVVCIVMLWTKLRRYSGYEVVWEKTLDTSSTETFRDYLLMENGMIRYSRDGAQFIRSDGTVVWEKAYQMDSPRGYGGGKCAVIYDCGGTRLYIFDEAGNTGAVTAVLPVDKAVICEAGITYALLGDGNAEYLTAFRKNGSAIDLSVKSILTGDGIPLDIAVSPDGTELLASYVSIADGSVKNSLIFRNFGDVGQSADARRVVGGFSEEVKGHMAARVHFSTDVCSQAFYDSGIVFFSTKVLTSPEVLANVTFGDTMKSIAFSEEYAAVLLEAPDTEGAGRLEIFDLYGNKTGECTVDMDYRGFELCEDEVLIYSDHELLVISSSGRTKAQIKAEDLVISAAYKTGRHYMLSGGNKVCSVKLK